MAGLLDKPIVSPILVGRAVELSILQQLTDRAKRGQGQVVFVSGEAGIGKTRLVRDVLAYATAHSFQVFQGNCFQPDFACPYAPVLDLLHNQIAQSALLSSKYPLSSELVRLLSGLVSTVSEPTPLLDPEQEKRRAFAGLTQFFIQQASTQPIVVVVEDIHWSDDTSLSFFHYLARRCSTQRIIMLLTYRSDEQAPNLRQWLAQMDREHLTQELRLAPLTADNLDEIIRTIFQRTHAVPRDTLEMLYALTEGNPFFLEEILKLISRVGENFNALEVWEHQRIDELHLPRSIQEAVRQHTEKLNKVAQQIIRLAAVIGRRFSVDLLRHLTGVNEVELLVTLKELLVAQLIVEESADQFAFRHALIRQVVYADLLVRERKALHQKIAEAIESIYAGTIDVYWADLAYHFWQAEVWQQALTFSIRAGNRSQALYAPRATIEHFTHAIDAANFMASPPSSDFYRARGQAYEMLGEFDRARLDYEMVLQMTRSVDNDVAAWQSLLDLGQLWAARDYTQTGDYYQRALEMARTLYNPSSLAHSLNRLGNWHVNIEQPLQGQQLHREAALIFEALGDQRGLAETYDLLGMASLRSSDLPGAAEHYHRAIAIFRQIGERPGLISSLSMLSGCAWNYITNTAVPAELSLLECTNAGNEALQIARDISWRAGEAYALICLSWCLGAQGQYGPALQYAQASLKVAEAIEHRQWMTAANMSLGAIYLDLLVLPKAQHHLQSALTLAREIGSAIWINQVSALLALTYLAQSNDLRAETLLDLLPPDMEFQTLGQRQCWYARAELAFARGDFNKTLHITEQLMTSAFHVASDNSVALPRLTRLAGEALAALHRWNEAEATLQSIVQSSHVQRLQPLLWRSQVSLGNLYQAMQFTDAAKREFATARQLIQKLAMNVTDEADRTTFLHSALAMTGAPLVQRNASSGLTSRETEVARLVAQGASNRTIADALVIGERTVESHVSSILSKLSFSSRSQIAAWVIEQGLKQAGS